MPATLSAPLLDEVSRVIEMQLGLHFSKERHADLEQGLLAAARELGFTNLETFAAELLRKGKDRRISEALARHLTVGETYFFRDPAAFDALTTQVFPEIARRRRGNHQQLRIWSAGCCTGEEPYSLAIAVLRALPDIANWHVSILATDINPRFLQKAAAGIYGSWSFRGVPEKTRQTWFRPLPDGRFEVLPAVRKLVTFDHLNLVEDVYPLLVNNTNWMDLIVCRNVLMYFSREQIHKTIGNLQRSLADGGMLLVSATEASPEYFQGLTPAGFENLALYRKEPPPSLPSVPVFDWQAPTFSPPSKSASRAATIPSPPAAPPNFAAEARRLANQGDLTGALAACDRALAADKLVAAHHYLRAVILQEQGDTAGATAALQRALYLDPAFIIGHFALGHHFLRQGRARDAARSFANARELLQKCDPGMELPESEGLTAGRLMAILTSAKGVLS